MIALDLSRLLSRAGRGTSTGIDRVELAYAQHLIAAGRSTCFAATTVFGGLGLLPNPEAEAFVAAIGAAWRGEGDAAAANDWKVRWLAWRGHARLAAGERPLIAKLRAASDRPIYLLVSHHHLERPAVIARLKARARARFVCLIHDIIPIDYPEYAKPGQAENHRNRIQTAARFADALIVNSAVTREALQPHLDR